MMECFINYGDGVVISKGKINQISEKIVELIKTEIPEEAQCITVLDSILSEVKSNLHRKRLQL